MAPARRICDLGLKKNKVKQLAKLAWVNKFAQKNDGFLTDEELLLWTRLKNTDIIPMPVGMVPMGSAMKN